MMTETGPIQLLAIAFGPDATFEGRIIEELEELTAAGQIIVLDLLVVQKETGGDLVALDFQTEGMGDTISALLGLQPGSMREAEKAFPALAQGHAFGLAADDIRQLADSLEPGTTAGFLLLEHRWARRLRSAVREQGGVPVAEGFLTEEVLAPIAAELIAAAAEFDKEGAEKETAEATEGTTAGTTETTHRAGDRPDDAQEDGMTGLVVLGFSDREQAEAVMRLSSQLSREELLDLEDAALAWRSQDGKVHVQQAHNPTATGAATGALWGTLFGMLFLMPVFGAAAGAATGAVAGKLRDVGLNDAFIKETAGALEPGRAAVFALVRRSTPDRVREALRPFHPTVLHTSLTKEREEELIAALHGV
ncbi:DUF1269 domain-containing protein [Streptomyces purpurogeneiscleroticus]|uniref:DUF1269 domain-containing protein n=1 Tax=Streptomyces purpurogeneiscleroticus TaxID=68259 RepID=UPI001CC0DCCC|nr:DUF1269 domain-containing protein [Streptomyces purpurogeneiscleroticus]